MTRSNAAAETEKPTKSTSFNMNNTNTDNNNVDNDTDRPQTTSGNNKSLPRLISTSNRNQEQQQQPETPRRLARRASLARRKERRENQKKNEYVAGDIMSHRTHFGRLDSWLGISLFWSEKGYILVRFLQRVTLILLFNNIDWPRDYVMDLSQTHEERRKIESSDNAGANMQDYNSRANFASWNYIFLLDFVAHPRYGTSMTGWSWRDGVATTTIGSSSSSSSSANNDLNALDLNSSSSSSRRRQQDGEGAGDGTTPPPSSPSDDTSESPPLSSAAPSAAASTAAAGPATTTTTTTTTLVTTYTGNYEVPKCGAGCKVIWLLIVLPIYVVWLTLPAISESTNRLPLYYSRNMERLLYPLVRVLWLPFLNFLVRYLILNEDGYRYNSHSRWEWITPVSEAGVILCIVLCVAVAVLATLRMRYNVLFNSTIGHEAALRAWELEYLLKFSTTYRNERVWMIASHTRFYWFYGSLLHHGTDTVLLLLMIFTPESYNYVAMAVVISILLITWLVQLVSMLVLNKAIYRMRSSDFLDTMSNFFVLLFAGLALGITARSAAEASAAASEVTIPSGGVSGVGAVGVGGSSSSLGNTTTSQDVGGSGDGGGGSTSRITTTASGSAASGASSLIASSSFLGVDRVMTGFLVTANIAFICLFVVCCLYYFWDGYISLLPLGLGETVADRRVKRKEGVFDKKELAVMRERKKAAEELMQRKANKNQKTDDDANAETISARKYAPVTWSQEKNNKTGDEKYQIIQEYYNSKQNRLFYTSFFRVNAASPHVWPINDSLVRELIIRNQHDYLVDLLRSAKLLLDRLNQQQDTPQMISTDEIFLGITRLKDGLRLVQKKYRVMHHCYSIHPLEKIFEKMLEQLIYEHYFFTQHLQHMTGRGPTSSDAASTTGDRSGGGGGEGGGAEDGGDEADADEMAEEMAMMSMAKSSEITKSTRMNNHLLFFTDANATRKADGGGGSASGRTANTRQRRERRLRALINVSRILKNHMDQRQHALALMSPTLRRILLKLNVLRAFLDVYENVVATNNGEAWGLENRGGARLLALELTDRAGGGPGSGRAGGRSGKHPESSRDAADDSYSQSLYQTFRDARKDNDDDGLDGGRRSGDYPGGDDSSQGLAKNATGAFALSPLATSAAVGGPSFPLASSGGADDDVKVQESARFLNALSGGSPQGAGASDDEGDDDDDDALEGEGLAETMRGGPSGHSKQLQERRGTFGHTVLAHTSAMMNEINSSSDDDDDVED